MLKDIITEQRAWLWPILAFIAITPITPTLDMAIAHYFYIDGTHFSDNGFYGFIFKYGIVPAQLTAIAAVAIFMVSFFWKRIEPWRNNALILIVTLVIGAGLVTHVLLKDHWGRPRPKQVIEFGGTQPFRVYYQPNFFHQLEPSKSFPCGHCTMGFYFFVVALIGYRQKNKRLIWTGLTLAFLLGLLLSITRMAQGGHFFSDTLASALIMWLTAYFCAKWIG